PLRDVALRVARGDEAVLVAAVAAVLASAVARYVTKNFRMLGGEFVRRADDFGRSCGLLGAERQRRQVGLRMRSVLGGLGYVGDRRGDGWRRRRRRGPRADDIDRGDDRDRAAGNRGDRERGGSV